MRIRVDWRTSVSILGTILNILALPLAAVGALAAFYRELVVPFLVPLVVTFVTGLAFERFDRGDPGLREASLLVESAWLTVALVGTLLFVIAGNGTLADPVNALFESMSSITTTGATVIASFDAHGRGVLPLHRGPPRGDSPGSTLWSEYRRGHRQCHERSVESIGRNAMRHGESSVSGSESTTPRLREFESRESRKCD